MVVVLSRPVTATYHANRCSCASCCVFCYVVWLIILPFIVAYAIGGFWTKEQLVREQPLVRFRHEALVEAHLSSDDSFGWSTSSAHNQALGARLRPCQLRVWSDDHERDGKPDALQVSLKLPLDSAAGERLHALTLLVGVEVIYQSQSSLSLNGTLSVQHSSALSGSRWRQFADLQLHTQHPLRPSSMSRREPCAEDSWMLQQPLGFDGQAVTAEAEMDRYNACNDTVRLVPHAPLWTPGVTDSFEVHLTVLVPSQQLSYYPGVLETLKLAWVQYLALFFPIRWVLDAALATMVRHGVVTSRLHDPLRPKQHAF